MSRPFVHAFYSRQMAEQFGTVFYRDRDGRRVACSIVTRRRRGIRKKFRWGDLRYVGRIMENKFLGCDEVAQEENDLWEERMREDFNVDSVSHTTHT